LTVQGDWPDDVNDLALMPRSNGLAGVNPALVVSVGSRQVTAGALITDKITQQTGDHMRQNQIAAVIARDHHDGNKPYRIGTRVRPPFWPTMVSIVVVGQTL
jgi:hypothetical protein